MRSIFFLKPILFFAIIFCGFFGVVKNSQATTINAASCSQTDVSSAVTSANAGDIITVPAGNCTWSGTIVIPSNKKITVQGSGIDATVLTESVAETKFFNLSESGSRVTNFSFINGGIAVHGKNWRIDHSSFLYECSGGNDSTVKEAIYSISDTGLGYVENVKGLIDNNQFHNMRIVASGGPSLMANEVWSRPLGLGTDEAVYVEDNNFTYDTCTVIQAMDANYGGSYVFRYNTIQDASIMAHAIQATNRATRKWEVYNNVFWALNHGWVPGFVRAGTGVWFNNALVGGVGYGAGEWSAPIILLDEQRSCAPLGDGGKCDGTSAWDGNLEGEAGYPCRDQIGRSTDNPLWISTLGNEGAYTQALDPAYAWNNFIYPTEADRINDVNGVAFGFSVKGDICDEAKAHLQANRDFYNNTKPKPGYVPYSYPHPLRVIIRADVDNFSVITTADALLTLRNSLGMDMAQTAWQTSATTGDVDCNSISNSTDALLILRYSVGLAMGETGWCE